MANLGTWVLDPNGYQNIATLTGITFTVGNTYNIQVIGNAHIRRGTEGRGINIINFKPFLYIPNEVEDIYIGVNETHVILNIDETVATDE